MLVAGLFMTGRHTEIKFKNDVPTATIENARWVSESGAVHAPESDVRLELGQISDPVTITDPDQGETGRVHFERVVEERKVALVTDKTFTAESGFSTTFTLSPSTAATNPQTWSAGSEYSAERS